MSHRLVEWKRHPLAYLIWDCRLSTNICPQEQLGNCSSVVCICFAIIIIILPVGASLSSSCSGKLAARSSCLGSVWACFGDTLAHCTTSKIAHWEPDRLARSQPPTCASRPVTTNDSEHSVNYKEAMAKLNLSLYCACSVYPLPASPSGWYVYIHCWMFHVSESDKSSTHSRILAPSWPVSIYRSSLGL